MKRREFMKTMTASAALWTAGLVRPDRADAVEPAAGLAPLPKRPLGKSGVNLSIIGFSGLVARDNTPEGVARVVSDSLNAGINFFDTAASYGNSEAMLAPVLKPHRKDIILATKTRDRTREGALAEFQRSCEILQTDYFDMFLVHGIQHVDRDVEAAFASGGAMECLTEMKKDGRIRLLGFSAHSKEAALSALDRYAFDFFYFPISYVPYYEGGFGPEVLARAQEKEVPCISLKAMARQHWPADVPREKRPDKCWYEPIQDPREASLALRWALSQPIVSVLPPGNEGFYRQTLAATTDLAPITPEETAQLQSMAKGLTPLFPR